MRSLSKSEARATYHHGDLRRVLMDSAAALLAEEQGWSFSLREVARRANVSHSAPSRHFASKGELLAALAASGYGMLTDRMRAVSSGKEPGEALTSIGVAYVEFAVANAAHYRLMFGPELRVRDNGLPPIVKDAAASAMELLGDVIRAGSRAGIFTPSLGDSRGLELAILSAWALVHGLAMLTIDGLAGDATPTVAESVTKILANGLLARS